MSNNKFKVEFTLKQHTPIIHFQSDQVGATLRATELKPKFDRFLLEMQQDLPFRKDSSGKLSLNYKVKVDEFLNKMKNQKDIQYTSIFQIKDILLKKSKSIKLEENDIEIIDKSTINTLYSKHIAQKVYDCKKF